MLRQTMLLLVDLYYQKRYLKSRIASPSLKNSGFDTTSNNFLFNLELIIFSILSPVVTGTVDLVTIILKLLILLLSSVADLKTCWRSADDLFLDVGVPTHINIMFELLTARLKSVVNLNLPDKWFLFTSSFNPGSKNGI